MGRKKGFKHTKETKDKIRKSHLGKELSKETKNKISNSNMGKKYTEEVKKRRRESIKNGKIKAFGHGLNQYFFGKNHGNYVNGKSKLLSPARYGDDWDKIRYLVYLRDKFTCQHCAIKGKRLDIHHKIPFIISFDNSLSNLITLCRSCHRIEEARIKRELKMEANKELIKKIQEEK